MAQGLTAAVKLPTTSSNPAAISPIIAGDRMTVDCATVWLDTGSSWQRTTLAQINPTAGTSFVCTGTGDGVGTAYVEAKLLAYGSASGPTPSACRRERASHLRPDQHAAQGPVDRIHGGQRALAHRRTGGGQRRLDPVHHPHRRDVPRRRRGRPATVPAPMGQLPQQRCPDRRATRPPRAVADPEVAEGESEGKSELLASSASDLGCTIWFTLELDSPDLLATMTRYGLSTDGYTPHISLAKKKWKRFESGAPTGAAADVPADAFAIHWSSDNFNITHQKSVMIDAVDSSGSPLAAGSMPATTQLLVSTGNFQDFQSTPFYAARDFYITTDDQQLINEASRVFASDFGCAGPTETNDLKTSTDLVWSNGTTGLYSGQVGQHPPVATGYFGPGRASDPAPVVQGNSFDQQYAVVSQAGAGDVLSIYNEEFRSSSFVDAVTAAAQAGADVRIVMSYEPPGSSGKPSSSMVNLVKMAGPCRPPRTCRA